MWYSNDIFINVAIFALGVAGFLVAKLIRTHKVSSTPLVCPVGFDCNAVVHSDYSKFFSVPVEIFGMIYYVFIAAVYLAFIFLSEILPAPFASFMALVSFLAFLFSLYLIGVQIFILKKGCSWCIVSAFICLFIFVLTLLAFDLGSITQIFVK